MFNRSRDYYRREHALPDRNSSERNETSSVKTPIILWTYCFYFGSANLVFYSLFNIIDIYLFHNLLLLTRVHASLDELIGEGRSPSHAHDEQCDGEAGTAKQLNPVEDTFHEKDAADVDHHWNYCADHLRIVDSIQLR